MKYIEHLDKVYGSKYIFVFDIVHNEKIQALLDKKNKKAAKLFKKYNKENDNDWMGKTVQMDEFILILIKKNKDKAVFMSTLVHELLHAMFFVFERHGVHIDLSTNNEHCTYYLDHLVLVSLGHKFK